MRYFFERNTMRVRKNTTPRDIVFLILCSGIVLAMILLMTRGKYWYGSQVDWLSQHSVLPEYFRKTFYQTGNLFPDFNFNLGGGQNAYNLAYYGYLSPVILISYFLPFLSMEKYIIISSIIIIILSSILMFYWLKMQPNLTTKEIYFGTLLLACSGPMLYHSHMQVMFVNYMPFLIMSLIGVDLMYRDDNRRFLTINVALMFLTSYFFAVSAMFAISIYAIYRYLDKPEKFIKRVTDYTFSCVVGVMISCVITLPALGAIISGRADGAKSDHDNIWTLFIPEITSKNFGYTAYCMGLPAILILALVVFVLFDKKKSNKFLGATVFLFAAMPILRSALNGFLYTREKSLIPFTPLAVLIIVMFANNLSKNIYSIKQCLIAVVFIVIYEFVDWKIGIGGIYGSRVIVDLLVLFACIVVDKLLLKKYKNVKYKAVYIYSALITVVGCIIINVTATLVKVDDAKSYFNETKLELINQTLDEDEQTYRFTDLCNSKYTNNHFWGNRYLSVGCYSSVINENYIKFCNYDLGINNPTVNDITVVPPSDVMFNTFMGVRYTVDDKYGPIGYKKIKKKDKYIISKNEKAYSLGFATNKIMPLSEFDKLAPEDKEMVLLQAIVVDDKYITDDYELLDYESKFERVDIDTSMGMEKGEDGYYHISTMGKEKKYVIDIPDSLDEYVYIIKCRIKGYTKKRAAIKINGMLNCLSGIESAFPNKNFDFKFVASSNEELRKLDVVFTEGSSFAFSELELYRIKNDELWKYYNDMTMMSDLKIENEKTLKGQIRTDKECIMTTTIPYDKGFTLYVDGEKTDYIRTDKSFIGVKLPKGKHQIKLTYKAMLANEGKIISLIGIAILLTIGARGIKLSGRKKNVD